MDSKIEPVAATDSFEIAATAAWDFIRPKLIPLNKEKGLAGVWSNGFRSGWDAKAREVEAALLAAEQRGREAAADYVVTWVDGRTPSELTAEQREAMEFVKDMLRTIAAAIRKGE